MSTCPVCCEDVKSKGHQFLKVMEFTVLTCPNIPLGEIRTTDDKLDRNSLDGYPTPPGSGS